MIEPVRLDDEKQALVLIDQRKLPRYEELYLSDYREIAAAIENMVVRGAPAIGITAAYSVPLGIQQGGGDIDKRFSKIVERLSETRPTAVNLFWALNEMERVFEKHKLKREEILVEKLFHRAIEIHGEDKANNREMGRHGARLLGEGVNILTHCNAGALATGGYGTALGIIRAAHEGGLRPFVWADETRPKLQGSRLTAWELEQEGIPYRIVTEGTAPTLMENDRVDVVITGADRVAANGDTANKIGTYLLALSCREHDLPFYVACPSSTIDLSCKTGAKIPIEARDPEEITTWGENILAPDTGKAYNPAFDITPAELITAIVTENGVIKPPFETGIRSMIDR